jgi:propionyl-CoA carboxylase alpha chain
MGAQAVQLARAVNYQSAGTVEFVVGKDQGFYFLEMNTRLQVEHPVTEMITGLDLVELMIRVAAGERLPLTQDDVQRNGWAMECRINAEDPLRNFLPSSGRLVKFIAPPEVAGQVRVDTGVYEGGEVSMYYDSMIAKLICHGATRDQAIARMRAALNAFVIRGVASNIAFQAALMQHPRFVSGNFNTGFIAEEFPKGFHSSALVHDDPLLLAAVAALARRRYIARAVQTSGQLRGHRRRVDHDWVVTVAGRKFSLRLTPVEGGCTITCDGESYELRSDWKLGQLIFHGTWNGEPVCLQLQRIGWRYRVIHWGTQVDVEVLNARDAHLLSLMPEKQKPDLSRFLLSPMPGLLAELCVKAGQEVKAGEKLAVIEAMKMENVLRAEADGVVKEVRAVQGDSLAVDQAILEFK